MESMKIAERVAFLAERIRVALYEDMRSKSDAEDVSAFLPWGSFDALGADDSPLERMLLWGYFQSAGAAWKCKSNMYAIGRLIAHCGSGRSYPIKGILDIGGSIESVLSECRGVAQFDDQFGSFIHENPGLTEIKNGDLRGILVAVEDAVRKHLAILNERARVKSEQESLRDAEHAMRVAFGEIKKHLPILKRKRRQLVIHDDYGVADGSKWEQEMSHFFERVVVPAVEASVAYGYSNSAYIARNQIIALIESEALAGAAELAVGYIDVDHPTNISSREFEGLCAEMLEKQGWAVRLTKASGDQGVDVLAERNGVKVAIQCKMYSGAVGNGAIQEVHSGKSFYGADIGVVVTTSEFTSSARELARTLNVLLLHQSQLPEFDRVLFLGMRADAR